MGSVCRPLVVGGSSSFETSVEPFVGLRSGRRSTSFPGRRLYHKRLQTESWRTQPNKFPTIYVPHPKLHRSCPRPEPPSAEATSIGDMAEGEEEESIGGEVKRSPYPPGFRFTPTDQELVEFYLLPRLQGRPHAPNAAIIDDYVYSRHPDDLLLNGEYKDRCREDAWYFLSSRARKYENGDRPSRGTDDGRGRWKAYTGRKAAVAGGSVGYSCCLLAYYDGPTYEEDRGKWRMRELTVPQHQNKVGDKSRRKTFDEFVMCKIYMTTRGTKNKEKDGEGEEEQEQETWLPAPVETGQAEPKRKITQRRERKRPLEAATPKQAPPPPPPSPERCLGPQAGPTSPTESLYGGGAQARFGATGYHHHYGGTGRPMAYNPHTSMPRPPMAFNAPTPAYRARPAASPAFLGQPTMMPHLSSAGQAFRPPRPMTVPSYPVMQQRQPETEEMRERRVYQQHINEVMMMCRMMQQQQQPGNAAAYAAQQPPTMPFMQQQQPYFDAVRQYATRPMAPPQFLPCNYHQPVGAGQQQVQCGYPAPYSGAATTTPAEAEAAESIGDTYEGTGVRGDCNDDEAMGSVEVPTEERLWLTAMTPNMFRRTDRCCKI